MIQTSGGDFSNLSAINFDTDVIDAGSMSLHFTSCSEVEVSFSLLEPTSEIIVEQELLLIKSVGIPNHVCNAPSLLIDD